MFFGGLPLKKYSGDYFCDSLNQILNLLVNLYLWRKRSLNFWSTDNVNQWYCNIWFGPLEVAFYWPRMVHPFSKLSALTRSWSLCVVSQMYGESQHSPHGIPRGYMAQMQGQLGVCGLSWCDFMAVCTRTREITLKRVHFSPLYWKHATEKLKTFCTVLQVHFYSSLRLIHTELYVAK